MSKEKLSYAETEGGPFILLPLELKRSWTGTGSSSEDDEDDDSDRDDEDEGEESDYDRASEFVSTVGVLDVGEGQGLILGEAEVTAFRATPDGGVFIQRVYGDDDAEVIAAVDQAVGSGKWKTTEYVFEISGKGKLALFDSAYAYADAEEDEILQLTLAPGAYAVETARVAEGDLEVGLVRLRRK